MHPYCRHCFPDGAFTEPAISMEALLDRCVQVMDPQGIMPGPQARALLADVLPRLKRWRVPADREITVPGAASPRIVPAV